MRTAHHRLSAIATPQSLDDVHRLLDALWADAPHTALPDRTRFTVITAELVANIVEHGHTGGPMPPQFDLDVELRDDAIHGFLADDGREPPHVAPDGRRFTREPAPMDTPATLERVPGDDVHATPESGRGLIVVRSSADELALTRAAGRNRWHYVVRPRATPAPGTGATDRGPA